MRLTFSPKRAASGKRVATTGLSMVVIVGVVAVIAAAGAVYFMLSSNLFSSTSAQAPTTAHVVNSTTGLELYVSVNASRIVYGQGVNVSIWLANAGSNNIDLSYPNSDWVLPFLNGNICFLVTNYIFFEGYVTMSNVSSIHGDQVLQPFMITTDLCPQESGQLVIYPHGNNSSSYVSRYSISFNGGYVGAWPPEVLFPVGTVTVIVGDAWGQLVLLHFTVEANNSASSTSLSQ